MDRTKQIQSRYSEGEAIKDIAADLGISQSTAYAALGTKSPRKGARSAHRTVVVRLTDNELAAFDRIADRYPGLNRSELIRRLMRMAADMPSATPEEEAYLAGLEVHLRALGGNFNQIAAALSASVQKIGRADPSAEQAQMIRRAESEVDMLRNALGRVLHKAQIRNARLLAMMGYDEAGEATHDLP